MKLLTSPTSPFARKARILIRLKNMLGRVEEITAIPAEKPPVLLAASKLGKVPLLILDDGQCLPESAAICLVLDEADASTNFHGTGAGRLAHLRWQGWGDGLMAHGVDVVMARRRAAGEPDSDWIKARLASVRATLDQLEPHAAELEKLPLGMGQIGMACALDFLAFRLPELNCPSAWPRLAALNARWAENPAFAETLPR